MVVLRARGTAQRTEPTVRFDLTSQVPFDLAVAFARAYGTLVLPLLEIANYYEYGTSTSTACNQRSNGNGQRLLRSGCLIIYH